MWGSAQMVPGSPTECSGNRCSWNASCRWAVAAGSLHYSQAGPAAPGQWVETHPTGPNQAASAGTAQLPCVRGVSLGWGQGVKDQGSADCAGVTVVS